MGASEFTCGILIYERTSDDTERPVPLKEKCNVTYSSPKNESHGTSHRAQKEKNSVSQGAERSKGKALATAFIGVSASKAGRPGLTFQISQVA